MIFGPTKLEEVARGRQVSPRSTKKELGNKPYHNASSDALRRADGSRAQSFLFPAVRLTCATIGPIDEAGCLVDFMSRLLVEPSTGMTEARMCLPKHSSLPVPKLAYSVRSVGAPRKCAAYLPTLTWIAVSTGRLNCRLISNAQDDMDNMC